MADTKTEVTVYRGPERAGLTAPGEPITARNAPAIVKAAGRRGYVHLNTSHDTSELACDSLCPSLTPGGPATSSKRSRSGCGPPGPALAGPGEWGYAPHTLPERPAQRALAHEGTAWLWLLGPFVEDWVRVRGGDARGQKREARACYLGPLLRHLDKEIP